MSLLDLAGTKGLVVGIADANSIAYGCAKAFHATGAELAIGYVHATGRADTVLARMASCAVALIAARRRDRALP
jgi:enoyl-[acyl-carrier protein] reductase I